MLARHKNYAWLFSHSMLTCALKFVIVTFIQRTLVGMSANHVTEKLKFPIPWENYSM